MSWAGLANNQTVSFNNLQNAVNTGVFTALTTIPVSSEQITKSDASTYVSIDTSYAPYAAKASNQLVVKSDLVASGTTTTTTTASPTTTTTTTAAPTSITLHGSGRNKAITNGWTSSTDACNNGATAATAVYSYTGTLTTNTILTINGFYQLSTTTSWYWYSPNNAVEVGYNGTDWYVVSFPVTC
jgi:hypothetical protein